MLNNYSRHKTPFLLFIAVLGLFLSSCRASGWHQIQSQTSPPALTAAAIAYNSQAQKAILFGGSNTVWTNNAWEWNWSDETWEWDGDTWRKLTPLDQPAGREKHAMTYDQSRNRIVLFGGAADGELFDDTWEWDGSNWKLMNPQHRPPARCCHAMAYDSAQEQTILYGGWDSENNVFFNDIWFWDGKDWVEVVTDAPEMSGHFLVDFPPNAEVISVQTSHLGTWVWDGGALIDLGIESPPSRTDVRAVYDPRNERIILFGGIRDGEFLNDTWIFEEDAWNQVDLPMSPTPRFGEVIFYDTKRNSVILFGGFQNDRTMLNDTWELSLPEDLSGFKISATSTAVP